MIKYIFIKVHSLGIYYICNINFVYTYLENRLLIHSYYNVHAMPTTHLAFLMNQVGTR